MCIDAEQHLTVPATVQSCCIVNKLYLIALDLQNSIKVFDSVKTEQFLLLISFSTDLYLSSIMLCWYLIFLLGTPSQDKAESVMVMLNYPMFTFNKRVFVCCIALHWQEFFRVVIGHKSRPDQKKKKKKNSKELDQYYNILHSIHKTGT